MRLTSDERSTLTSLIRDRAEVLVKGLNKEQLVHFALRGLRQRMADMTAASNNLTDAKSVIESFDP